MDTLIEVEKDYGEWTVPSKWADVTLKQMQEIESYYDGKDAEDFDVREVLQIFCNKTKDEVDELPIEFTEKILQHLTFINNEKLEYGEPKNSVEIDGEVYSIHYENQLRTGEYVAVDSVIKDDKHNYAGILAILCRKEGEVYDSRFENEVLPSRVEMFENISVVKLLPLVSFFFELSLLYMNNSRLYTAAEEAINLIAQDITSSKRNGALWRRYMLWRVKKLQRSLQSIKHT